MTNRGRNYRATGPLRIRCTFGGVIIGGTSDAGGQRLTAFAAGGAVLEAQVGQKSGQPGSHDSCLDWSWADNKAYLIAGRLEKLRRRMQGLAYFDKVEAAVRRNTNTSHGGNGTQSANASSADRFKLASLRINSTLLENDRLEWFMQQSIGKMSLTMRNLDCEARGPSGRAGQNYAEHVHSLLACVGDTDVWGLSNVRLEIVFMEVSNMPPGGQPAEESQTQLHMAFFTVVAPSVSAQGLVLLLLVMSFSCRYHGFSWLSAAAQRMLLVTLPA